MTPAMQAAVYVGLGVGLSAAIVAASTLAADRRMTALETALANRPPVCSLTDLVGPAWAGAYAERAQQLKGRK